MITIAKPQAPVLSLFAPAFTAATFARAQLLGVAAILTTGRRTVANLLRTAADLTEGDPSCYHRVLSLAQWSGLHLGRPLDPLPAAPTSGPRAASASSAMTRTVTEHPGRKVYGKARHRDPRPLQSQLHRLGAGGTEWGGATAILVSFPFCSRPWALPVLVALYHSPQDDRQRGRRPPHPGPTAATAAAPAVALVPRSAVRRRRRRRLRQPRDGVVGGQVSGAAGRREQMPRRRQPVCAPPAYAGKAGRASRAASFAHAAGGSGPGRADAAQRGLVRRRPARRRGGERHGELASRPAAVWSRCVGSTSTTVRARTETNTSTART